MEDLSTREERPFPIATPVRPVRPHDEYASPAGMVYLLPPDTDAGSTMLDAPMGVARTHSPAALMLGPGRHPRFYF